MPTTKDFNPEDLPSLAGKVIFVTGGTAGLGRGSILTLARHGPAAIVFSGRNAQSAEGVIADAKAAAPDVLVSFVKMDLTSLASVQEGAHQFLRENQRLDILMNNAGVMATSKGLTKDGYEVQFGTNHMGHALLTKLLMPLLETTAATHGGARVVSLTSIAYKQAPPKGIVFDSLHSVQSGLGVPFAPVSVWCRYGQSKLANLLYSKALAAHHPSVVSVAVHPGIIGTGLFGGVSLPAKPAALAIQVFGKTASPDQGFYNQVWAATADVESGAYYEPVGVKTTPTRGPAKDAALVEKLWAWTQDELKGFD